LFGKLKKRKARQIPEMPHPTSPKKSGCNLLQFAFPGQLPLAMAGYILLAVPIAILFLFSE